MFYHVTPDGDWGPCRAQSPASCPYGDADGSNHYQTKAQAVRAAEDVIKGNSTRVPLVGKSGGKTAYLQDGVPTKAPLARIDGVPTALSPTELEYDDAVSSLPAWEGSEEVMEKIKRKMMFSPDPFFMDEGYRREDVTRPWQDTYMGKTFDGGDPFPVDPEARRLALDHKATEYDERLSRLTAEYEAMRDVFFEDPDGAVIPDFSVPRMLTHWGRALADEKAVIESMGGESHFKTRRRNGYLDMRERDRVRRESWEARHPGEEWRGQPSRFDPSELRDPHAAIKEIAKEICVLQGRPGEDAEELAWDISDAMDDRLVDEAIHGRGLDDMGGTAVSRSMESAVRDAYLERPMTNEPVLLIDIEATGLEASNIRIQDVGHALMRLDDPGTVIYGESSKRYGMGASREVTGNPTVAITGITTDDLRGKVPLENDPKAHEELLGLLTARPFVAHNATYEDSNFMTQVRGYAEARRDGRVRIIDTAKIARRVEDVPGKTTNSLEAYAKRWGVIAEGQGERHLGLEDAVVMGLAVNRQMRHDHAVAHGLEIPSYSGTYDTGRSAGTHYDKDGSEVSNG